ncbi:FAD-binding protein [Curtobacterium ammoniigenes]|uniref:FAD-binding protein n=1 Tax=Curtobacterium ammoniigenes TaxID=395387 RepID=UPI00082F0883|nr:FAD-binding protein [Curtobacterium ammoniigenes]
MLDEQNWSGTITYRASAIERPASVEAVQDLVARLPRVRALGTRHSFNDVADTDGVLIDMTGVPADLVPDAERSTISLGAGARYGLIAPAIDAAGLALHNMGSLPHISIGGAIATGTHGSGTALGSLSTAVTAMEFVDASGSIRRTAAGDASFPGLVLHLGRVGVVTRVTLAAEPSYEMRQDRFGPIPWSTFLANIASVFDAATSVCCFTGWDGQVRETLLKSRIPTDGPSLVVPDALLGAPRLPPTPASEHRTAVDGTAGPWWDRLPHFPITGTPSVGSEVQSEHFVPLRFAADALDALMSLHERIRPHLHVTELRTMAADDLWLSPSQGEPQLCIAFTWKKHPQAVQALLPDLEARLASFGGRPHWGKMSSLDGSAIAELYPRLPAFRDLIRALDPDQKFRSPFSERVLGC